MRRRAWIVVALVWAVACGGEAAPEGEVEEMPADSPAATGGAAPTAMVMATLRNTAGTEVGTAHFTPASDGVALQLEVRGLPPGTHGVHVHEVGRCEAQTDTAFSTAGGHLNPSGREHGLENPAGPHAGDLPNVEVGPDGTGRLEATALQGVADGLNVLQDADGSALVVHANADDQRTDQGPQGPGNSGARIACGVVMR